VEREGRRVKNGERRALCAMAVSLSIPRHWAAPAIFVLCTFCFLVIQDQPSSHTFVLETKHNGPKKSAATAHVAAAKGRGRVHGSDMSPAQQLKEEAQAADREARELRKQANSKYDKSQELSRQTGIMTHRVSRITREEASLHDKIQHDANRVKSDVHKLAQEVVMKAKIERLEEEDSKDAQFAAAADKTLALARSHVTRDQHREGKMKSNVKRLLSKASALALQAQSSLTQSHHLQLDSESNPGGGGAAASQRAADQFQQANALHARSGKLTRHALDERSKARLDREYVAMLRGMLIKDDQDETVDAKAAAKAKEREEGVRREVRRLRKTLAAQDASAIRQDRQAHHAAERTERAELEKDKGQVAAYSAQAKREEKRAMHLVHASHKLQAEAAAKLALSTKDIQLEEDDA